MSEARDRGPDRDASTPSYPSSKSPGR